MEWIDIEIDAVNKQISNRKNSQHVNPNFIKKGARLTYEPYAKDIDIPQKTTPILNRDILESSLSDSNSWLKFIGTGTDRIPGDIVYTSTKNHLNRAYLREIKSSKIKENDIFYITAFSYDENGAPCPMVIGKAVVSGELKKDNAIENKYKCYFEFKQAQYVDTEISKTISLNDVYSDMDLKKNYMTKSHIEIDEEKRLYLDEKLEELFRKYGYMYIE